MDFKAERRVFVNLLFGTFEDLGVSEDSVLWYLWSVWDLRIFWSFGSLSISALLGLVLADNCVVVVPVNDTPTDSTILYTDHSEGVKVQVNDDYFTSSSLS